MKRKMYAMLLVGLVVISLVYQLNIPVFAEELSLANEVVIEQSEEDSPAIIEEGEKEGDTGELPLVEEENEELSNNGVSDIEEPIISDAIAPSDTVPPSEDNGIMLLNEDYAIAPMALQQMTVFYSC